jgi:hypothetical protein
VGVLESDKESKILMDFGEVKKYGVRRFKG